MTSNKTTIGLFESIPAAQQAIADLQRFGVSLELLSLITAEELKARQQSRAVGTDLIYDDLLASLYEAKMSPDTAQNALSTVGRGGALVSALVADHSADDVYQIMLRNGAIDYAHHAADHDTRRMRHEAFLNHYQRWVGSGGLPFDHYLPAYQFGYDLGNAPGSRRDTWAEAEREARQAWDREARGSWEQFKQAIRYGWEKACGRV
jgi:hypothetical protein